MRQRQTEGSAIVECARKAGFAGPLRNHRLNIMTPTEGFASAKFALNSMARAPHGKTMRLLTADVGSGTSVRKPRLLAASLSSVVFLCFPGFALITVPLPCCELFESFTASPRLSACLDHDRERSNY